MKEESTKDRFEYELAKALLITMGAISGKKEHNITQNNGSRKTTVRNSL